MENRTTFYNAYKSTIPEEYKSIGKEIYNQLYELRSKEQFFEDSKNLVVKTAYLVKNLFGLCSEDALNTGFTGTYLIDILFFAKFKSKLRNDIYSYLLVMDLSEGHSPFGSHFGTRDYIISLLEKALKSSE